MSQNQAREQGTCTTGQLLALSSYLGQLSCGAMTLAFAEALTPNKPKPIVLGVNVPGVVVSESYRPSLHPVKIWLQSVSG